MSGFGFLYIPACVSVIHLESVYILFLSDEHEFRTHRTVARQDEARLAIIPILNESFKFLALSTPAHVEPAQPRTIHYLQQPPKEPERKLDTAMNNTY